MRHYRRILGLTFGLQIVLFVGIWLALVPMGFAPVDGPDFQADLPRLWPAEPFAEAPWTGRSAHLTSALHVATTPVTGDPRQALDQAAAELHCDPVESIDLPVGAGRFLLSGRGKHWRATLLLHAPGRLVRVECHQARGNAADPLYAVARMAASVRLSDPAGASWMPPPLEVLEDIVRPAVDRHLMPASKVLPPMMGFLVLVAAGLWLHGRFAGRIPADRPTIPPLRLAEPNVYVESRRRWQRRGTLGAMVLDGSGLRIYSMGRELAHVPPDRLGAIRRPPGRKADKGFEVDAPKGVVRVFPDDARRWASLLGIPLSSPTRG